VLYGQSLILAKLCLKEVEQSKPLTIRAAVDQRFISSDRRGRYRAGSADWLAQVRPGQIGDDLLYGAEEKYLVFYNGSAERSAKLLAVKILERLAV